MKHSFPAALSALVLPFAFPAALPAQEAGDAMIDVTCEEFLSLPAADQEMHATALTTARMDEASATAAPAEEDDEIDEIDEAEVEDEETTTATAGVGMNILSPTVVALVTICENSVPDSESDTGATAGSEDSGVSSD